MEPHLLCCASSTGMPQVWPSPKLIIRAFGPARKLARPDTLSGLDAGMFSHMPESNLPKDVIFKTSEKALTQQLASR